MIEKKKSEERIKVFITAQYQNTRTVSESLSGKRNLIIKINRVEDY